MVGGKHEEDGMRGRGHAPEYARSGGTRKNRLHPSPGKLTQVLLGRGAGEAYKMHGFPC